MEADWNDIKVVQHRILELRGRREYYRILLRRYGDSFILHAVVVVACVLQLRLFMDAFQNPHGFFTHTLFATTYTSLNVFLFAHFVFDIIVLVLLHFIFAPRRERRSDIGSPRCTCMEERQHSAPFDTVNSMRRFTPSETVHNQFLLLSDNEKKYVPLSFVQKKTFKPLVSETRFSWPPVGPLFDILWSCVSIASGINEWRTHPFFFFRLMGYAIHHSRIPCSLRVLISLNKRLYDDGHVVLDMTYITDRVIAMGLPAVGIEKLYRNPMHLLATYLRMHHPSNHIVINTCAERVYNRAFFHKLFYFPCKDHEVMPLDRILVFCQLSVEFLTKHPTSVLAVHCMGGKGRTGLMVTSWLIYSGLCNFLPFIIIVLFFVNNTQSALDALHYYARRRTDDMLPGKVKTLSNACQLRFLWYFEALCQLRLNSVRHTLPLKPPRRLQLKRCVFSFDVPKSKTLDCILGKKGSNIILHCVGLYPPKDAQKHSERATESPTLRHLWDYLDVTAFAPDLQALVGRQVGFSSHYQQLLGSNTTYVVKLHSLQYFPIDIREFRRDGFWDFGVSSLSTGTTRYSTCSDNANASTRCFVDWTLFDDKHNGSSSSSTDELGASFYSCPPETFVDEIKNASMRDVLSTWPPSRASSRTSTVGSDPNALLQRKPSDRHHVVKEFGIKILARSAANQLRLLGKIWLHADFLHVGIPPNEVLQQIFKNNNPKDMLMPPPTFSFNSTPTCLYQALQEQRRPHIIVGYRFWDIDFKTREVRKEFAECNCFLACLFEVMDDSI